MKFIVILTLFAAPVNVADNAPLTLQPTNSIEFKNTTEKNTLADCVRVQKALTTSRVTAYCGAVQPIDAAPVIVVE